MLSVLVVSPASRFLELVSGILGEAGVWAVCVGEVGEAIHAVRSGFRPDAVVIDPAAVLERGGDVLSGHLARWPALSGIPVFSISAAVGRHEVAGLLGRLGELGPRAHGART